MKKKLMWLTFIVASFAGSNGFAQAPIIEHLVQACESDLKNYCSQVTPGDGRLLHCMAAHEDKISGQCEYAFYQAASLLEQLSVAIAYVARECETELKAHCSDIALGEGRVLACLESHQESVGEGCKKAVAGTVGQ